jgi:hypothetical protein
MTIVTIVPLIGNYSLPGKSISRPSEPLQWQMQPAEINFRDSHRFAAITLRNGPARMGVCGC